MPRIRPPGTRPETNTAKSEHVASRYVPGQSGNREGRKPGSRVKLAERFLADMMAAWERHGVAAADQMAKASPAQFVQCIASLQPKQLEVTEEHLYVIRSEPLSPDEWAAEYAPETAGVGPANGSAARTH
jgi:hypothetical protein